MISPRTVIELTVRLKPDSALGARLTASVMQSRAPLVASNCYRERGTLVYRFVSEGPEETEFWLREAGFMTQRDTVVLVDVGDEVRALQRLVRVLTAAGIGVRYTYSSVEARGHTVVVFKTADDPLTLQLIQNHSFTRPSLDEDGDDGSPNQPVLSKDQAKAA